MRVEVDLPDELYQQAAAAAKADRSTLNSLVKEAVAAYMSVFGGSEELILSPEQISQVQIARRQSETDDVFSLEEAEAHLKSVREEWLRTSQS